jgi:hypothetical protein
MGNSKTVGAYQAHMANEQYRERMRELFAKMQRLFAQVALLRAAAQASKQHRRTWTKKARARKSL